MAPTSSSPEYLDLAALGARTGLSTSTIRRWAKAGWIPCFQPAGKGGKLLFPPDAIEQACAASADALAAKHDAIHPHSGPKPAWMCQPPCQN